MRPEKALFDHLVRLAAWSVASLVAGLILALSEVGLGFGGISAGWAVVNLLITAPGLLKPKSIESLRKLREFLALNLGLNVAYMGVGITVALTVNPGAGWAVVIQGLALFVLDGWLMAKLPTGDVE